jgi:hypothetical protein
VDTIMATRLRSDGRLEHSVLDENGMPTEWRLVVVEKLAELDWPQNPEFN